MGDAEFWQILGPCISIADLGWLVPLRSVVSSVVVFGCQHTGEAESSCREAYGLLKILDATEALIVDKEPEYISNARRWFRAIQGQHPGLFGSYGVTFAVSDMTWEADQLGRDRFDLAYCSGVLYCVRSNTDELQAAVDTMARVVRRGGFVIAREDEGLDGYFEGAGLQKVECLGSIPRPAYCYRKP
jgi:hypothetical protein